MWNGGAVVYNMLWSPNSGKMGTNPTQGVQERHNRSLCHTVCESKV